MKQSNIRNFCIIAHIDHGKSTLADRFLEVTNTIEKRKMHDQVLDTMELEQERGITIKLQPVRMTYRLSQTDTVGKLTDTDELLYEDLTYKIRGAVFTVRKELGSGHKENVYHNALKIEFEKRNIAFESEKNIDVIYEEKKVGVYRPDFLVDNKVIVELKALPYIGEPIKKQAWNYLKGSPYELELLVNFGPQGAEIKRIIDYPKKDSPSQSVSSQSESVYQLNLIDTPGHVDFTYEVSRSLAACEGAILVVDSTQGIQAQTLANVNLALEHDLKILPVVNKIDLPNAEPERVAQEIIEAFGFEQDDIMFVSAKTGEGVEQILHKVIEEVPVPNGSTDEPFRALIFDSDFDKHRGVIAYVRVVSGGLSKGDELQMMAAESQAQALELGYFSPELTPSEKLSAGEVGYIVTGLRDVEKARVGDTVTLKANPAQEPLPGYKDIKPMVYASIFPSSGDDYPVLRDAMEKLKLNDAALTYEPESIPSIGFGFRTGFLGLLHMDIVQERLSREFDLDLVLTAPSVAYKVLKTNGDEMVVYTPVELPDPSEIASIAEPWVTLDLITPEQYMGPIMEITTKRRGVYKNTTMLGPNRMNLHFEIPLSSIVSDYYDRLKSVSSGFASMNYELIDLRVEDLVKVDVLIAGDKADPLSFITHSSVAEKEGRSVVEKLKDLIPKQQFAVALQATIGGKIIARETISALRKDVTAKLYGGDVTRKQKLLKKQKAGKKRLKKVGKVEIPQKAFLALMKK